MFLGAENHLVSNFTLSCQPVSTSETRKTGRRHISKAVYKHSNDFANGNEYSVHSSRSKIAIQLDIRLFPVSKSTFKYDSVFLSTLILIWTSGISGSQTGNSFNIKQAHGYQSWQTPIGSMSLHYDQDEFNECLASSDYLIDVLTRNNKAIEVAGFQHRKR